MRTTILTLSALAFALPQGPAHADLFLENTEAGLVGEDWIDRVNALDPDDPASLNDTSALSFVQLVSRGMAEQAFSLQNISAERSAVAPGPKGAYFGLQLTTFPLTPPPENLVGKTENTAFSPVLPRLGMGYVGGEGDLSWGLGFNIVPPLKVQGAFAFVVGSEASIGYSVSEKLTIGAELDVSLGQARAPVVATPEAYEAGDLPNIPEGRYEEACAPQEFGCIDTLTLAHAAPRVAAYYQVSDSVAPYLRLGGQYIYETFNVQVDLSEWRLKGWLPTAGAGVSITPGERVRIGLGASGAYHNEYLSDLGAGLFWRLDGGISYAFGAHD